MADREIWKPIPGFPGYEISDHGRGRSFLKRPARGSKKGEWDIADAPQRILRGRINSDGYRHVNLRKDGRSFVRSIAQLVLLAFVGPLPAGMETCHNDGNRINNHLSNLRYDTRIGNQADRILHGTSKAKLSDEQAIEIRERRVAGASLGELTHQYSVADSTISRICSGQSYAHLGFPLIKNRTRTIRLNDKQVVEIREKRAAGILLSEIACQYSVSSQTISRICLGYTYARIGGPRTHEMRVRNRGYRGGTAKLNDEQVIEIREKRAAGASLEAIAGQYSVTDSTIARICSGKSYVYLGGPLTGERQKPG